VFVKSHYKINNQKSFLCYFGLFDIYAGIHIVKRARFKLMLASVFSVAVQEESPPSLWLFMTSAFANGGH